jgi:CBS domain-containing protein
MRVYLRAAIFHQYGTTLYVGIGIPIPILNEDIALRTGVSDEDIVTKVLDYGIARRSRSVLRKVSYKELKSGSIEIDGSEVRTAPLSSYFMAKKVAEELKAWIEKGEFTISQPVERLAIDTAFKPMKQTKEIPLVKDVMIREVTTIKEGATIEEATNTIVKGQFTHLPVVSDEEKLVGIVTAWDISKAVAKRYRRLEEIMTRKVITGDSEEPLELVVRKLEKYNISALPVIDKNRTVIGIVTSDGISRLIGGRRRWLSFK